VMRLSVYQYVSLYVCPLAYLNGDQLSLTNPRDSLHHDERAANKEGGRSV